jgi:MFS family permease
MPAAQQQQQRRSIIPRQGMYGMLAAQAFSNYITRGSLAPLVQFIVADLRMSAAQKALLLGAFFPVFTPCQVFAGPLCQLFGAKRLLSVNLGGMASLLLLMPSFARVGGVGALCVCLAGIGVCQSPLVPAQGQLKRNWLPDGPERVWGQRIIGLGMRVGYPAAASVTPWIAQRFGWRAVPYCLGAPMLVFSTLWHVFAAERPADEPVEPSPAPAPAPAVVTTKAAATAAAGASSDSGSTPPREKKMEWSIFKLPAVLSAVSIHVACNNMGYCFLQWTPTYYNEVLRLTDIAAAKWISFPGAFDSPHPHTRGWQQPHSMKP